MNYMRVEDSEYNVMQRAGEAALQQPVFPSVSGRAAEDYPAENIPEASGNLHIQEFRPVIEPELLCRTLPVTPSAHRTVMEARQAIRNILSGEDKRLLVVVGPCSLHDEHSALEYAEHLSRIQPLVADTMLIIMRAYFEKPRTTVGWKGMLNDPHLNGTCDMAEGLKTARRILLKINETGMPTATEMLDPSTPAYLGDLVSWSAIGARTTESQTHREMASGLSMPVGFKNSTDGSLSTAVNAIRAAAIPHTYPGISPDGQTCIVRSSGNSLCHVVLRGGATPNYDPESIEQARLKLAESGLPDIVMVDCSHDNSRKDYRRQGKVFRNVIEQRIQGNCGIIGLMLESHLHEGNQSFSSAPDGLAYGVSITDACISWEETESLLRHAHTRLSVQE